MRNAMFAIIPALCVLLAVPVAAQRSPQYEAPSAADKQQLEQRREPEMSELRGGDGDRQVVLSDTERERIEEMVAGQVERIERLHTYRAGNHVHMHWGVWVAVPCAFGTVLLVVLLVLLLV